jgi:hypothetical protein
VTFESLLADADRLIVTYSGATNWRPLFIQGFVAVVVVVALAIALGLALRHVGR